MPEHTYEANLAAPIPRIWDFDQDMDGYQSGSHGGDDCNDVDPFVYPGATDHPEDGIDQDCSGEDATTGGSTGSATGGAGDGGGCGCSTSSAPAGSWGWLLAGLAWLARRRR